MIFPGGQNIFFFCTNFYIFAKIDYLQRGNCNIYSNQRYCAIQILIKSNSFFMSKLIKIILLYTFFVNSSLSFSIVFFFLTPLLLIQFIWPLFYLYSFLAPLLLIQFSGLSFTYTVFWPLFYLYSFLSPLLLTQFSGLIRIVPSFFFRKRTIERSLDLQLNE